MATTESRGSGASAAIVAASMSDTQRHYWREIVQGRPLEPVVDNLVQQAFEGKPIAWEGLNAEQKSALEAQLQEAARELRVRGDYERAAFFKEQLKQMPAS